MPERRCQFVSNEALVLCYIAHHPQATLHEIAEATGLRDRSVWGIMKRLREDGIVTSVHVGRKMRHTVHMEPLLDSPAGPWTLRQLISECTLWKRGPEF